MIELDFYSPEEEIQHPIFLENKVRVFIKRDDLIHPYISGNKWRKLKYLLLQARAENKNHLVTFGGIWSNHLLATACAAAKFGFKSTGFVRGEDLHADVLMLCRMFGMNLIFTDRESYRDKQNLFDKNFKEDRSAFFIDEGGVGVEAVKGCAELVDELKQEYQHVFCACGTGTTAAGILNGLTHTGSAAKFHAISVLKGDFLKGAIDELLLQPCSFEFYSNYHFGGYAKTEPPLIKFINEFTATTGILLDPVYTGKMMFALVDLITQKYFLPNSKILAVHTGGLLGLLGMKDKFLHS
ncbi:MAG: pyridoxal-phosphate dependent enzyme [Pyrinomonadaceae bacterium]|nr:pyridoxal-phosphate dependent enzyme [Sphingobacteriaceae bacterium]